MKFIRALLCWIRHIPEWESQTFYNHEGEASFYRLTCKHCGRVIERPVLSWQADGTVQNDEG